MSLENSLTNKNLIETGLESNVYSVKDHYGQSLILKKHKSTCRQNYLFEVYAYERLGELGALVPTVVRASSEEILMTRLSGNEMDDQLELYGDEQLFIEIAQNLALSSKLKFQGFGLAVQKGDSFVGKNSTWAEFLSTAEQLFKSPHILESGLDKNWVTKLKKIWKAQKPNMALEQGVLVHGDFAMSSIFVNDRSLSGIIDFGDAFIGDPLMDIAYFRFKEITKNYGQDIYQRLLRHYANTRKITVNNELEQKIIFYMIYWGLKRLEHCPDEFMKEKFTDKLRVVASLL